MDPNSRLRQNNQNEDQTETRSHAQHASASTSETEFATPEALLRHDAAQTPVPPRVADRLLASIAAEPPAKPAAWWRRLFGR